MFTLADFRASRRPGALSDVHDQWGTVPRDDEDPAGPVLLYDWPDLATVDTGFGAWVIDNQDGTYSTEIAAHGGHLTHPDLPTAEEHVYDFLAAETA